MVFIDEKNQCAQKWPTNEVFIKDNTPTVLSHEYGFKTLDLLFLMIKLCLLRNNVEV